MAKAGSSNKIKSRDNILDYILLVVFIFIIILTLYPFLNVLYRLMTRLIQCAILTLFSQDSLH